MHTHVRTHTYAHTHAHYRAAYMLQPSYCPSRYSYAAVN